MVNARKGFALIDAILGGALLALGLAGLVTLSQRSLAMLQRGEHEAIAAAMLDELLAQVVTEGPGEFSRQREQAGRMPAPWPDWEFEVRVQIEDSNVVSNGVYIGVDTQYRNDQDWESFVGSMPTMFAAAANAYGLGFEPFAGSPDGRPA